MRSGVQDQPGQHGETSYLLKIQKLAGYGGAFLSYQLLGRVMQENRLNPEGGGCGEPRSHHCLARVRLHLTNNITRVESSEVAPLLIVDLRDTLPTSHSDC